MTSRVLPALFLLVPFLTYGQTDTNRVKAVKSAPIEMMEGGTVQSTSVSSTISATPPYISGDFTVCSAHPKCVKDKTVDGRTKCTSYEVLLHLVGQPKPERPKSMSVVQIDFDIDAYGDVKAIRSNTGSEPALGKALIVALSSLPKFEAAKNGEARAASHCAFSYAVDDLFPVPSGATNVPAIAFAPPSAEAPPPPTAASVKSGDHLITGAFTVPSTHPACSKGKPGQITGSGVEDNLKCTAEEVLKQIRSKLKAEAPAYMDIVVVDFDIDQYGDVKTIRANCASELELGKAVIVALYGMPKFIPAKKDAARVASHCTFQYPVADLFAKP